VNGGRTHFGSGLSLCPNISEVIVMADNPKCELYDPRDKIAKPNCPNCYLWLGVQCEEHLMLVKKHMTARKFESIDRMMCGNRGVWIR